MIGKNFYFDGKKIPYTAMEGHTAGWYAELEAMNVQSEADEYARQGTHGIISYPTFARGRVINISGIIFGTKENRGENRKKMEEIFRLPFLPKNGEEFKTLEFEDDDGSEWTMKAKMLNLPQYRHDLGEYSIDFSFALLAENPVMYSKTKKTITGNYGRLLGVSLPVSLPTAFPGAIGGFSGENEGNFPSETKIKITGEIVNPKITNLTTGIFWKTETTLETGDELIIDGFTQTIKKNGADIISARGEGSAWIFHTAGTNKFVLTGDDFALGEESKATAVIEFYHARL